MRRSTPHKRPPRETSSPTVGEEVRRLTRQLQRSEAYCRALIENVSDLISVLEADGTIRYISPSVRHVLGYEPHERAGRPAFDLVHPDDVEGLRAFMAEAIATGRAAAVVTYRYRHHDGSWRRLESRALNLLADPAVSGIVVTSRDITDQVAIEGRYRSLFDNMGEGVAYCRMLYAEDGQPCDWVYLDVNRAFEALSGLSHVAGRKVSEVIPDILMTNPELVATYGRVAATGGREKFDTYVPGLHLWFAVSVYGTDPTHFVAVFENITERKSIEERLRRSEVEHRSLVEHAPLGIFRSTPTGRFLAVNSALVTLLGYASAEEVLRLDIARDVYMDPGDRARVVERVAQRRGETTAETHWRRKDGTRISVRLHVHPVYALTGGLEYFDALVEDVTEQRLLAQQFQQAQKMEAVGRLAGGVAHDFNNLLTAIIGYNELLLDALAPDDPRRLDAKEIGAAAQRATGLTRQLLAFSRKQLFETRILDLNEVVRPLEKMLQRLIGEDVTLTLRISERPPVVRADPGQLEQVLMNLAVNARDAMATGGALVIETGIVDLSETDARAHAGLAPGPYARLAVRDTGAGMTPEVLAHLFEPFFTTKEPGKGTGLGLSTVYGIIKQSGGVIWADSEPGHGTTFTVLLPSLDALVEASPPKTATQAGAGGHETVLVVEDEVHVRDVLSRVLSQKGYRVLLATDGQVALAMAAAYVPAIDLLVTDLVLPGMTGRDLATALTTQRLGLRVLFMSGYTDDAVIRHGLLETGLHYLQKPFTPDALARRVREVLNEPA